MARGQLETSPWVTLTTGALVLLTAGTLYLFPVYSSDLAVLLGMTDKDMSTVAGTWRTWFTLFTGVFYDKAGPRWAAAVAVLLSGGGYLTLALSAYGLFKLPFFAVATVTFLIGQGTGLTFALAYQTNLKNFHPRSHGRVAGFLSCCFGLCSGVFTSVYQGIFRGRHTASFILMIALSQGVLLCASVVTMNVLPPSARAGASRSNLLSLCTGYMVLVAGAIGVSALLIATGTLSPSPWLTGGIICLFLPIILIPAMSCQWTVRRVGKTKVDSRDELIEPLIVETEAGPTVESCKDEEASTPASITERTPGAVEPATPDATVWQAVCRMEFWFVFMIPAVAIGTTMMVTTNLKAVVASRYQGTGAMGESVNTLSALFSVSNTLGRLLNGLIMDAVRGYFPKALQLAVVISAGAAAMLMLAMAQHTAVMYCGVVLMGLSYGGTFAIYPTMTVEYFGVTHIGTICGLIGVSPAIAVGLFNGLLASTYIGNYSKNDSCRGIRQCFTVPLFIAAGACLLSSLGCVLLTALRRRMRHAG